MEKGSNACDLELVEYPNYIETFLRSTGEVTALVCSCLECTVVDTRVLAPNYYAKYSDCKEFICNHTS